MSTPMPHLWTSRSFGDCCISFSVTGVVTSMKSLSRTRRMAPSRRCRRRRKTSNSLGATSRMIACASGPEGAADAGHLEFVGRAARRHVPPASLHVSLSDKVMNLQAGETAMGRRMDNPSECGARTHAGRRGGARPGGAPGAVRRDRGIAKTSGHDFLFIDTQHALFSLETIGHIAQAAMGCGVATLVRVPRFDDPDIAKLLDAGAMRHRRRGRRQRRAGAQDRRDVPVPAAREALRPEHLFADRTTGRIRSANCCASSTPRRWSSAWSRRRKASTTSRRSAAVDGVDVVHLGCTDLLADMGKPGAFDDPELSASPTGSSPHARRQRQVRRAGRRPRPRPARRLYRQGHALPHHPDRHHLPDRGASRRAGR